MNIKRLCILPCGSAKIWDKESQAGPTQAGPTQAQYVYTGVFASICQRYAKSFFEDWVILTAKYGFLLPDVVVEEAYNVSFNKPNEGTITIDTIRDQVLLKGLYDFDEIVVLGGINYIEQTKSVFNNGKNIIIPLINCSGIGYMLQKLSRALENGAEIGMESVLPELLNGSDTIPKSKIENSEVPRKRGNGKYVALYVYLQGQDA